MNEKFPDMHGMFDNSMREEGEEELEEGEMLAQDQEVDDNGYIYKVKRKKQKKGVIEKSVVNFFGSVCRVTALGQVLWSQKLRLFFLEIVTLVTLESVMAQL